MSDQHAYIPLILRRMANKLAHPFGINPFARAFEYGLAQDRAAAFDTIFNDNLWGSTDSASGVGSELDATAAYRAALAALCRDKAITRFFDAPCGDLNWMPALLAEHPMHYAGGDISPALIARIGAQYPDYALTPFDITTTPFPTADVWHCRDCLFHLPFADIGKALRNFAASSIPYALLTTHRARWLHKNLDLNGVGFRMLDLERAPFCLPPAIAYLPDYRTGKDFPRYVGLWSREAIASIAGGI